MPIQELVLKVHQRCNLACDYCYVYTFADQSWRDRPMAMAPEVWLALGQNLARYITRHELSKMRIILHGGEPLLFGVSGIRQVVMDLRRLLPSTCTVEFGIQTNGMLLNADTMQALRALNVRIGVSIDGPADNHDLHRRTHDGHGTSAAVARALDELRRPENRSSYAGVLCTISPATDPVQTYDRLTDFEPPSIDFLLPHANWGAPPRRLGSPTEYGDWLATAFDRWYDAGDGVRVRLFEDAMALLLGGSARSEQLGLSPTALVVIESDGSMEQVDSLRTAYPGACATGLDVRRDELDAVFDDPGFVARQLGRAALSEECIACPVHRVCGAGHYVHRFRPGHGFRERSVYCADLMRFIHHVRGRIAADIHRRMRPAG